LTYEGTKKRKSAAKLEVQREKGGVKEKEMTAERVVYGHEKKGPTRAVEVMGRGCA